MKFTLSELKFDPNYPQANYMGVYNKTTALIHGVADYENDTRERFTARVTTSMYGAMHATLVLKHPISLSETTVYVTVNKARFNDATDMDEVLPRLVEHACKKHNDGVLIDHCVGIEYEMYEENVDVPWRLTTPHLLASKVWQNMRRDWQDFTIKSDYVEGRYLNAGEFNEFVHELKGMGASIKEFAPGKYVTVYAG